MELRVVLALAIAFSVGAAVIGLAALSPRQRGLVGELWALYRSEFLVVGLVLLPAAFGGWAFLGALLVLTWRGQIEMARLFDLPGVGPLEFLYMAAGAVVVATGTVFGPSWSSLLALGFLSALAYHGLRTRPDRLRLGVAALGLIFPALFVAQLGALRASEGGFGWLVLVFAVVEINDAFALVFGKLFGRTLIMPRLSPRKTAEGLFAGLICGAIGGLLVAYFLLELNWRMALPLVAVILAGGLIGDLATSALKRRRDKKDFAPVHALHGGLLDIYDSLLFAAPLFLLAKPLLLS